MAEIILKASTLEAKKGMHFLFTLRYNCIERKDMTLKKCENKEKGAEYYFQRNSHCILVQTYKGIKKQASEHTTDNLAMPQSFNALLPQINLKDLVADYSNKFVSKDELEKVVGQDVISLKDVDDVMAKLINEMEIRAKEDRVMCSMADVKCMVYEKTKELHNAKRMSVQRYQLMTGCMIIFAKNYQQSSL